MQAAIPIPTSGLSTLPVWTFPDLRRPIIMFPDLLGPVTMLPVATRSHEGPSREGAPTLARTRAGRHLGGTRMRPPAASTRAASCCADASDALLAHAHAHASPLSHARVRPGRYAREVHKYDKDDNYDEG